MALCLYSQALRYNCSLIHFYSIIQRWRKWVSFYWIAVKINVKDKYSFWCLGQGCAFHTLDVAGENADPGHCSSFQAMTFSGEKRFLWPLLLPSSFLSPILHSHRIPLPPTTALPSTPGCYSTSMCHPWSCPSARLVRRIPESSPPSSPPTHLALILSAFESRNFSPPRCLTPVNITKNTKETDSWLSFQVPGPVTGCGSLQLKRQRKPCLTWGWNLLREDENFRGSTTKPKGVS